MIETGMIVVTEETEIPIVVGVHEDSEEAQVTTEDEVAGEGDTGISLNTTSRTNVLVLLVDSVAEMRLQVTISNLRSKSSLVLSPDHHHHPNSSTTVTND